MKKKLFGITIGLVLVAVMTFMLVGCTVSGTYTNVASDKSSIAFSGSNFTYIPIVGKEIKGKFEGEKLKDEDKEKVEAALTLVSMTSDALKGAVVLKNDDGTEIAAGFYGKNEDGKDYVVLIGTITGVFVK